MEAIRRRRNEATLAGQTGTGKSHMAQAFGHCAARQGHNVLFISQTELFKRLDAARATGCYDRKFQQLAWVPLLIVIDFALKPLRVPRDEDLHVLIAARSALLDHPISYLELHSCYGKPTVLLAWHAGCPETRSRRVIHGAAARFSIARGERPGG